MVSEFQRASEADPDYPTYPWLAEASGEDPGRFLYGFGSPIPRIKTLDEEGVTNYLYVELEEDARKDVIAALNKRRAVLRGDLDSMDETWSPVTTDAGESTPAARDDDPSQPAADAGDGMATADHDAHAGAARADGAGGETASGDPAEIAALLDADRAADLLERERSKDEPREDVIEALEARLA